MSDAALSPEERRRYERRLRDELAKVEAEIADVVEELLEPSGAERYQDVDESVEESELDTEIASLELRDEMGSELREALERLANGTYGSCESCSRPIERARLDELPHARVCAECARKEATRA